MADAGVPKIGDVIHQADMNGFVTELNAINGTWEDKDGNDQSKTTWYTQTFGGFQSPRFTTIGSLHEPATAGMNGGDIALVQRKAVVDALAEKVDKSLSPHVSRAIGLLDETGFENIMGVLTYHRITRDAGIFAGDIIFGNCSSLTNYFNLPLSVISSVLDIPYPTETCYGTWSIEGPTADKVATLTGKGRVLRLSDVSMSFERLYDVVIESGTAKTGAWPFSQFSNSSIHFQVVVV